MLARVNNHYGLLPWKGLSELQREFLNAFGAMEDDWRQQTFSRFGVEETEKEFKVTACLPGIEMKDIDVEIVNDFITIKAKRPQPELDKEEKYLRSERSFDEYEETLKLGAPIRTDAAKATYKNGVLEIVVPKSESAVPKRITVGE